MKQLRRLLLLAPLLVLLAAFTAAGAETNIRKVSISLKDISRGAGNICECSVTSSYHTEIESVEFSSWPDKAGENITVTVAVNAASGYKFTRSGEYKTEISVSGGTLANTSFKTYRRIVLRITYKTKMMLGAVDPSSMWIDTDGTTLHWDAVPGCSAYEIKLTGGNQKTFTVSGKNYVNLSPYITNDLEDTKISIRAVPKNTAQAKYLIASGWVSIDETISTDEDNTVSGLFEGVVPHLRFRISDSDSDCRYYADGWQYIGKTWYYFNEDNRCYAQTGWLKDNGAWYYFDPNTAAMRTGWLQLDSGNKKVWYYLTGSGAMATGWIQDGPGGKWYFLDPGSGAMWYSATTPDGYKVGPDGAWTG